MTVSVGSLLSFQKQCAPSSDVPVTSNVILNISLTSALQASVFETGITKTPIFQDPGGRFSGWESCSRTLAFPPYVPFLGLHLPIPSLKHFFPPVYPSIAFLVHLSNAHDGQD